MTFWRTAGETMKSVFFSPSFSFVKKVQCNLSFEVYQRNSRHLHREDQNSIWLQGGLFVKRKKKELLKQYCTCWLTFYNLFLIKKRRVEATAAIIPLVKFGPYILRQSQEEPTEGTRLCFWLGQSFLSRSYLRRITISEEVKSVKF